MKCLVGGRVGEESFRWDRFRTMVGARIIIERAGLVFGQITVCGPLGGAC